MDQVQQIGSHNSYRPPPPPGSLACIEMFGFGQTFAPKAGGAF
ncbi:hypothetical protein V474_15870 [Novosphingobium barchaimii LL02]|uniref:Uncharacterized protein n=1 Tax=Novosphingobium barchaimii LL02 TaxID=1114963 RepID=A0A0J7XYC9_9SPHN|nr:hypothetical protein V474_15870 [Novosphingobium barchaimii LL02]